MNDSLEAKAEYESLAEYLLGKSDPLENFLNQMHNELGRLRNLQTYLKWCFPLYRTISFDTDKIILSNDVTEQLLIYLDHGYVLNRIEHYPLQKDDSDNYERHTDGK